MNSVGVDRNHVYASVTTSVDLLWYQVVLLSTHHALVMATMYLLTHVAALRMMDVVRKLSYLYKQINKIMRMYVLLSSLRMQRALSYFKKKTIYLSIRDALCIKNALRPTIIRSPCVKLYIIIT